MSLNRNVNQIIAARNVRRRATPYIIGDKIVRSMIAKNFHYSEVTGTHQATADWIRNRRFIFLNGVSLHALVMKERAKVFMTAVNTFLADDAQLQNFIVWKMLCIATEQQDFTVSENVAINILEMLTAKTWEQALAPAINEFPQAQVLYDAVQAAKYVFAQADEEHESARLLEEIWREHLITANLPEAVKAAYVKKLFATAHQGGFLYSLATAYMQAFQVDSPFRIHTTKELSINAFARFTMCGNTIEINESLPIYKIYNEDYSKCFAEKKVVIDELGVEREVNVYLFEPNSKHEIKMQGAEAVLNIVYLQDHIYSQQAVEALCTVFPEIEKVRNDVELYLSLADYADLYLGNGHDYTQIERLFALFPNQLNSVTAVKQKYYSFVVGRAQANAKGDKILSYLGAHYNDYVAELIECEDEFHQSEQAFVLYLKLLYRLGNAASFVEKKADKGHAALVVALLKKYYAAAGVTNIDLDEKDLGASKYQEAYRFFVKEGVFAGENKKHAEQWSLEEQMARNPAMLLAVIEGVDEYVSQRTKVIAQEKNSKSSLTQLSTFFVSEEERTRGLRRAEAVKYLLLAAPTQFAKRIVVYCIVANTDGVELKKSINDAIKTFTSEILKRVITKDLMALNIPDYDFTKLENDIINPLIAKISSMTPKASSNPETAFASAIQALMSIEQRDTITHTAGLTM